MCGKSLRPIITRNRWPRQNVRPDQFQFCCCRKVKENTCWGKRISFESLMFLFWYHESIFKIPLLCSCGMNSWQYLVIRNDLSQRDHQSSKSWQVNEYDLFWCILTIKHCWFFIHSYLFNSQARLCWKSWWIWILMNCASGEMGRGWINIWEAHNDTT